MKDTIEIPFIIEKRRIIIFANINGVNGKFLWDTGCENSLINNKKDKAVIACHVNIKSSAVLIK